MSEALKWSVLVCAAAFCSFVFEKLFGSSKTKKTAALISGAFFLACAVSGAGALIKNGAGGAFKNFSEEAEEAAESGYQQKSQEFYEKTVVDTVSELAEKCLYEHNIEYKSLEVKANTEDGGVEIEKITVCVQNPEDALTARNTLFKELAIETEVYISE